MTNLLCKQPRVRWACFLMASWSLNTRLLSCLYFPWLPGWLIWHSDFIQKAISYSREKLDGHSTGPHHTPASVASERGPAQISQWSLPGLVGWLEPFYMEEGKEGSWGQLPEDLSSRGLGRQDSKGWCDSGIKEATGVVN